MKNHNEVALVAHPSIVLPAFASELYLKCLICIESGKSPPKEHKLTALFLRLDLPTRKRIENLWDEDLKRPHRRRELICIRGLPDGDRLQTDLPYVLGIGAKAFEELRYLYETEGSHFLFDNFPYMLRKVS